ncbi:hypothetical protein SAY87_002692 [Trapa incisa]|uniref:Membrane-associated kinase regulator 4 n=1 Tax=Trapa incisa TaxID=236973 RepID=A0AAN7JUF0_9MYRT|nr:hypothetical protein SAY87_002692 [Trapa incisa]
MGIDILSTAHSKEEEEEEEDYIDLEVSSYSIFHCNSVTPPSDQHQPFNREFEFMSSGSLEREQLSTSLADELFYNGKLLPLHLPPRLQMVEKLLENPNKLNSSMNTCEEFYRTPLGTSPSSTPVAFCSTPFQSCNVSPSESCNVSQELNPNEYPFGSLEDDEVNAENPKKSWGKKMKLIKQYLLGPKMKSPQAYVKSLLSKYSCSNESCASSIRQACTLKAVKEESKSIHTNGRLAKVNQNQGSSSGTKKDHQHHCKRTLSTLSMRRFPNNTSTFSSSCSSSSSSSDSSVAWSDHSNGFNELRFPKRIDSRSSEMENPIQGAIKHCKLSQHEGKSVAVCPESV